MATREDLEAAVEAGILTEQAAADLAGFWGEKLSTRHTDEGKLSGPQLGGEEPLRFIRNFHDIFLAMGLQILCSGIFIFAVMFVDDQAEKAFQGIDPDNTIQAFAIMATKVPQLLWLSVGLSTAVGAVLWLLAEYFAGRKRLFFPAIIICLNFATTACAGAFALYAALFFRDAGLIAYGAVSGDPILKVRMIPVYLVASALLPIIAYYIRFKLPFAMGLIGIGASALIVTTIAVFNWALVLDNLAQIVLTIGVLMFVFGMVFDIRDPARITRFSDNGFWLHLIAAPFILIGFKVTFWGWENALGATAESAPILLAVITLFGFISLLINRRALVVSGMLTAGIAFGIVLQQTGMGMGGNIAATMLSLGAVMVLLGAGWHWLRRMLVSPLPKTGLIARIFPPEIGADG